MLFAPNKKVLICLTILSASAIWSCSSTKHVEQTAAERSEVSAERSAMTTVADSLVAVIASSRDVSLADVCIDFAATDTSVVAARASPRRITIGSVRVKAAGEATVSRGIAVSERIAERAEVASSADTHTAVDRSTDAARPLRLLGIALMTAAIIFLILKLSKILSRNANL